MMRLNPIQFEIELGWVGLCRYKSGLRVRCSNVIVQLMNDDKRNEEDDSSSEEQDAEDDTEDSVDDGCC